MWCPERDCSAINERAVKLICKVADRMPLAAQYMALYIYMYIYLYLYLLKYEHESEHERGWTRFEYEVVCSDNDNVI